ncbi:MAG TPA: FAD-dependent oxidoreductase, partial [Acidimicrobiales bacterium]|nr:FAD-dependent oxidoreductase [Acidimicrobiales bacterium]
MDAELFDLVVIGSGPAGEKGAAQAAYHGRRVAVVERSPLVGGTAVATGGLPNKALRETALYVSGARKKEVYGVSLELDSTATFEQLRLRAAEISTLMSDAVMRNIERHSIELVRGEARLEPGRLVQVVSGGAERSLRAGTVLVAT